MLFSSMDSETVGKDIKLKAGLEIHQQLDAGGRKLFCNCPSILRYDEPDFTVKRKFHIVAGEGGKIDVAAMHEIEKGREFIYQGYDTNCLVELDESPPNEINKEALKISLQIAFLLNMKILPISQIMRKTVVDGSNTSGFQRTVLIARDGFIETSFGRVKIKELYLEEDAARIIERGEKKTVFRLDRLGIPLVEITTAPDLKTPEQIKETALKIGEILRSVNVKRGLGTIRQDLNISVGKHPRVEIKGFQNPRIMVKAIELEMKRQNKIDEKGKPEVRNVLANGKTEFLRPIPGAARMYPETDLPILKISRKLINETKRILPRLRADVEEKLRKEGLTNELIKLILGGYLDDFEELLKIYPKDPQLIAKMLTIWRSELAAKLKKDINQINRVINLDKLGTLLEELKKGSIDKNQIKPIFSELMKNVLLKDIIMKKIEAPGNIEEKIMNLVKSKPGLSLNAYMGLVMKDPEFKGKISGKEVMETLKKYFR